MMKGNEMTVTTALPVDTVSALRLIATATFRPFNDADWDCWAGCVTESPMIAELNDLVIIVDGDVISFNSYHEENGLPEWSNFSLHFDGTC